MKRIEAAGLKAFIDYRDFKRGAPSIKECERGVLICRKTLLILTPNYLGSGWTDIENVMVQTLDPANETLRLIPLLKADCKKPLRIGALTHIDFTDGADLELAWQQLLTALGRPPEPPKQPKRDDWFLAHPYPMPPNFTGRKDERTMLTEWLTDDSRHPLLVLRALGGFGKSALCWHWLMNDVKSVQWPRMVWWSFYEGDASFDNFLAETLDYLSQGKIDATKIPGKNAVKELLRILHQPGTLLVLDGFERALRAFGGLDAAYQGDESKSGVNDRDCISPLAEFFIYSLAALPNLRSRVLLTTRLCPRILEARGGGLLQGCREEELRQMRPDDAVEFFHAQGIRGTHTEIETACEPYGYHPLSLRLLAGLIVGDFQQPGDIAAAKRLDVSGDLKQRQHHILEVAYDRLTPARKTLLGHIACFRSPMKYESLRAIDCSKETLDSDLRDLVARSLLHHDIKGGRFDLHPIVRSYAYDRLAAPDRAAAHTRLRDYFAAVPKLDKVMRLEDLAPVIELYHHTVRAGQLDEAFTLFHDRLNQALYYQLGASQLQIDLLHSLFPDGEDCLPRLKEESRQAWTLNELANSSSLNGQLRRAVPLFEQANAIEEKLGDKNNLAIALGNVAHVQFSIGALRAADGNLRRYIALSRELGIEEVNADAHQELGRLLAYRGAYAESEAELVTALKMFEKRADVQGQGIVWAYRALRELLRLRSLSDSSPATRLLPLDLARRALELADEYARTDYPIERDYVQVHWLLGAAHRVAGHTDEAEHRLHDALERCRRSNLVEFEANILIDLARLRAATSESDEARRLAKEAAVIAERSGYVLQGADAHLELAKLALACADKKTAKEHAQKAKELAFCDGPPDCTYKVAYDEACALIEKLGRP